MSRFCANCGTEVDETALFCPTCGQPIDQDVEAAIPPAPSWPEPDAATGADAGWGESTRPMEPPAADRDTPASAPEPQVGQQLDEGKPYAAPPPPIQRQAEPPIERQAEPPIQRPAEPEIRPVSERRFEVPGEPVGPEPARDPMADRGDRAAWEGRDPSATGRAAPPPSSPSSPAAGTDRPAGSPPAANLPVTAPVTLSGWLIGVGAGIAALGALIALFDSFGAVMDLLLLVALAGVAVSVFFATALPAMSQLRLATLAIVVFAFGAAVDRLLLGAAGAGELLLFLGTAAAVIGVFLVELGRDQPLGGPQR